MKTGLGANTILGNKFSKLHTEKTVEKDLDTTLPIVTKKLHKGNYFMVSIGS